MEICSIFLSLLPLAYLVYVCVRYSVDVPFWDEWAMVPRFAHLASGTFTFRDLWQQHNEHRPLVPVATILLLAQLSGWNLRWEIAVSVLLGAGILGVFWAYLRRAFGARGGAPFWLLPALSLLVFSPVQWENWTWGWQIQVVMGTLASLMTIYLVALGSGAWRTFISAIACAVWATYSFGAGLILWLVQPAGIWLAATRHRPARLVVWCVAGAATFASYFYDYHAPPQPSMLSNFTSVSAVWHVVLYMLSNIGAPLTMFDTAWAPYVGAIAIVTWTTLVVRMRPRLAEPAVLFPALVGLQTMAIAGAAALSRSWMGIDQALSSRYCTMSIPLWCAVLCLAAVWRSTVPVARAHNFALAIGLSVLLAGTVASGQQGVFYAAGRAETLRFSRRGLIVGRSNVLLLTLYPNLDELRRFRSTLLRLHLSVFRPGQGSVYPHPEVE
jgi:hypothetical protein